MPDNDIRDRIVERLARADYGRWQRAYDAIGAHQQWSDKAPSWDDAPADHKRKAQAIRTAERIADDLGDIPPTLLTEPVGYITGYRNADGDWHVMFDGAPFATRNEAVEDARSANTEAPEFDWRALTLSESAPRDDQAETAESLKVRAMRLRAVLEGKDDV